MKKKVKKEEYPQVLFVIRENDGDSYYFIADDELGGFEDGEVAVYEFVSVKQKKTSFTLE